VAAGGDGNVGEDENWVSINLILGPPPASVSGSRSMASNAPAGEDEKC
jgi:hypothetical protein